MMVPVNQNIDEYKDDFFKGLTMRQTMYAIAAVAVSGGLMTFFLLYLKMNASVAMYITLPIVFPIIAMGFIKVHGLNFREYLERKRKVQSQPVFFYQPEIIFEMENSNLSDDPHWNPAVAAEKNYSDVRPGDIYDGGPACRERRNVSPSRAVNRQVLKKNYLENAESIAGIEAKMKAIENGDTKLKGEGATGLETNERLQGADTASPESAEDGSAAAPHL